MAIKRLRDHYDWVVLGDHPGALLSASLVARLGLSVLVLPLGSSLGVRISEGGQCFDPETNFLIGLRSLVKSKGLLAECLSRVGITPQEELLIRRDGILPQVLTPEARVEFALGDGDLLFELEREFGRGGARRFGVAEVLREAESGFLKYWSRLPERLTWASGKEGTSSEAGPKEFHELLSSLRKSVALPEDIKRSWLSPGTRAEDFQKTASGHGEFAELCEGLWFASVGTMDKKLELAQLLHMLALARTGASFRGGLRAYREFLLRVARRSGVHVIKAECRRIFVEKGRFVGVQVAQHGAMIGAGSGVFGCLLDAARDRMAVGGRQEPGRLARSPAPAGWKFSVSMSVHAEAIPPGMLDRVIWQERGAPPLELEVATPADYGLGPRETKLLHMRTVLPFTDESLAPAYQVLIATRMLRQAFSIMPFLEYHVTKIYPDFRKAHPSLDSRVRTMGAESPEFESAALELREAYPFSSLADIPGNLRVYSGSGVGSRSGVEGLFVASEEAYPELGTLGGTVAAIEAVAWVAHRSGLAGPLV